MERKRVRVVYGLCDPREKVLTVRYVGCTAQKVTNRVQAHLNEAIVSDQESPKLEWLRELLRENLEPFSVVLETVKDGVDWEEREQHWIAYFVGALNRTKGGRGIYEPMPDEVKRKISRTLTGRKQSEETKAKRKASLALTGYKHSDEIKRKIGETHRGKKYGPLPDRVKSKLKAAIGALVWINNGSVNRRVSTAEIPKGWIRGRI